MTLHFRVGEIDAAKSLIERFHYSHRWPANVQIVGTWHENGGLFGDYGDAIAACVFSIPPTRWAEPVLELSRLVRAESTDCALTGLIAQTCKWAKSQGVDLLVSFADWTQLHHGGIYQASSWKYGGMRERNMDGVVWRGEFIPGRSANSRWHTRSPAKLAQLGIDVKPHYDYGKHIYWRALTKNGQRKAQRLKLQSLPYPKPLIENT